MNLALFNLALWEGNLVEVVDQRTGKRLTLLDHPIAAPNFQKYFVCHEDLSQYTKEAFIIYARGKDTDWSEIFKIERPCLKARWENDRKVFVTLLAGRDDEGEPVPAKEESYCLVKETFKICK